MLVAVIGIAATINLVLVLYLRRAVVTEFDNALREKAKVFVAFTEQVNTDYDGTQVSINSLSADVRAEIDIQANGQIQEIERIIHDQKSFYKVETSGENGEREFLVAESGAYLGPFSEYRFAFEDATFLEFQPSPNAEFYLVREGDEIIARSPSLLGEDITLHAGARYEGSAVNCTLPGNRTGRAVLVSFVPRTTSLSNGNDERLTLVLARSRKTLDYTIHLVAVTLGGATLLLGVGLIPAARWVADRGLRPLRTVANATAAIDETRLNYRFEMASMPVELVSITQQLNVLLDRLHTAFQREQRFTSDAAHELRTPIAELRALAEVGLRGTPNDDAAEFFRDALAIADQMEHLVAALLALARGQAGQHALAMREVDVELLITEAVARVSSSAQQNGVAVVVNVPKPAVIKTDPALLTAIIKNLLSNAVENSPTGTTVLVSCSANPFHLEVKNTSTTLQESDLKLMFEPFWRKDNVRSNGEHYGIGLSIVAAFAPLLGFRISAQLPRSDTFTICIDSVACRRGE
ncbi:MAG: HAMP domain-containing protein [Candidatus Hydrogenedentes bacterium]|nr:HAMP domain-containing protein [Candidatus Hydrogenedentota bacterium]